MVIAGLFLFEVGYSLRKKAKKLQADEEKSAKSVRRAKFGILSMVVGGYIFLVRIVELLFGHLKPSAFHVALVPARREIAGISVSTSVITTWIIMGVVLVLAVLLRLFVISKMTNVPGGIQSILEIAVDGIDTYKKEKVHGIGENLSSYLFTVAVLLIGSASVELFGVRAPTADITMTMALALITFVLINYYGLKKKGMSGRIKSLADPTPIVFPLRVISDIAIPLSMACRLFGNMLGGMIVMELLYNALAGGAVGIPSVIGLYFNVFHPLIQAFIFITLTLTFINEAVE